MQINAQKSKVMAFHETPAQKRKCKEQVKRKRSDSLPTYPFIAQLCEANL